MGKIVWLFFSLSIFVSVFADPMADCKVDEECFIDLKGTMCADGTPSFLTLTKRKNARHLLIYLRGGGACWSRETCQSGMAKPLTRKPIRTDWNTGQGIHNAHDPINPFRRDYHIVTVPYCTGDLYTGARSIDYGSTQAPYVVYHHGYMNVLKVLDTVKREFPSPQRVVLAGCSAGGIGVYYHLRNLESAFPSAKKYAISDAGTPFSPPHIVERNYRGIMLNWGANTTLPVSESGGVISDFGSIIEHNTKRYESIRFGLISSYYDKTMRFFALAAGTLSPLTVVRDTIIDLADSSIAHSRNARVFYTDTEWHCHTPRPLGEVTSLERSLGDWLRDMVEDRYDWVNVRPDKQGF